MKKLRILFLTILLVLLMTAAACAEGTMALLAINVRKADCLLLQYEDVLYMIDTGSVESWGSVSATLTELGITHLDGVILTHTDDDHAGGLMALASSSVAVDTWYASRYYADVKTSKHPARLAAALRDQEVTWLRAGDVLPFGSGSLRVLGPISNSETENCNSLVLLAEGGGGSMLLTGDMEFAEETDLLNAGSIVHCTVLKVANHGEKDATSEQLVNTVRPQLAVISTNSEDEPDTPANRVLKALKKVGAQGALTESSEAGVLVTVENGTAQAAFRQWSEWPAQNTTVRLLAKDNKDQTTTLANTGTETVDVSAWYIHSERGNEIFVFPEGSVLQAGQTVTITCTSTGWTGDYLWQDNKVWHSSKEDAGVLYDRYGRMIDRLE